MFNTNYSPNVCASLFSVTTIPTILEKRNGVLISLHNPSSAHISPQADLSSLLSIVSKSAVLESILMFQRLSGAFLFLTAATMVAGQAPNFPLTTVRSIDGSDGNTGAQAGAKLLRMSGYDYPGDGSGNRIKSFPNPRIVSNRCLRQKANHMPNEKRLTDFVWAWGQFIE